MPVATLTPVVTTKKSLSVAKYPPGGQSRPLLQTTAVDDMGINIFYSLKLLKSLT